SYEICPSCLAEVVMRSLPCTSTQQRACLREQARCLGTRAVVAAFVPVARGARRLPVRVERRTRLRRATDGGCSSACCRVPRACPPLPDGSRRRRASRAAAGVLLTP